MEENIDECPAVNPTIEPVDKEDNAARDEGEEEEDTKGGGSEEWKESSQEEEDDDDGGYPDLARRHSNFKSVNDEDALLMPSSSTSVGSSKFSEHSSDAWSYDNFDM
ncbi:hypothetical protein Salat_1150800 [Sesamum alatum]|uniref:Uncharacterized protein n=1 Tax=Sesamum alatum TaxID=300844 RepID=A0AAE2CND0_9LAMI|nr:hypothetical protein Salat_1150800 [Sesamum alatum]